VNKHIVYLSLGTNLGDRLINLKNAVDRLKATCKLVASSSVYETDPWGFEEQPSFYNQVISIKTELEPLPLLRVIKGIEVDMGRIPTFRYGPRLIDIDILLYDNLMMTSNELKLPHPEMTSRTFVLTPLAEIAPKLIIPGETLDVSALYQKTGTAGIRKLEN
jgi:2-amino-4-hydroxy-6-hydroxymethyldihydropteridine diphosphokinase